MNLMEKALKQIDEKYLSSLPRAQLEDLNIEMLDDLRICRDRLKEKRSPSKSIGEAARQQTQALIQDLILFAHDALTHGQQAATLFDALFSKQIAPQKAYA